jgi:4-hydroxybenzoate polyprenyltransferase
MVVCWVAGFDILYALADLDFDRSRALSSLPARLGRSGAVWAARALHAGAIALLAAAWSADARFGPIFAAGALLAAALLITEHLLIACRGDAAIPLAFFTLNGVVALALGLAGVVDVLS